MHQEWDSVNPLAQDAEAFRPEAQNSFSSMAEERDGSRDGAAEAAPEEQERFNFEKLDACLRNAAAERMQRIEEERQRRAMLVHQESERFKNSLKSTNFTVIA